MLGQHEDAEAATPFTAAGSAVAQVTFFLQHLLLLPALLALARSATVRGSRPARLAAGGAVMGLLLHRRSDATA